jgi:O-antigen/teichoic acid export membrane protein
MSSSFSKNSLIYTLTTVFQKGVAFFLIPVYSIFIEPKEYGIISLILATVAILTVFFTLSFDAAIVRFYYDYRHNKEELKKKVSTLFLSLGANSILAFTFFMLAGPTLFKWVLPNVDFYPYIFLGLLILVFQPFYLFVLGFYQTTENAKAFSFLSIGYFITHLTLTITLVVFFEFGGVGILTATLISAFIFSCIGLYFLRDLFVFTFDIQFVKSVLRYTLPLIPHSLAGHLALTLDRFLLNGLLNSRVTGVYYLGYQLSYPIDVISLSFNRAFVPTYFNNVEQPEGRERIRNNASLFFAISAISAFGLSIWGPEMFKYLIDKAYLESLTLLPIISFSFVATTIYYIHSCIFFYRKEKVYLVAVSTISANVLNLGLNVLLIPRYGIYGAAYATLASQLLLAITAFVLGRKLDQVSWPTFKYFILFILLFLLSLLTNYVVAFDLIYSILLRLLITFLALILISSILLKGPFHFLSYIQNIRLSFFKK